jgi:16S rRNA processing protein RimM
MMTREQRIAAARGIALGPPGPPTATAAATRVPSATPPPSNPPADKQPTTSRRQKPGAKPQPKEQREPDPGYVAVGRIQTPHGLRGELKVTSLTENPDRFRPKAKVLAGQQPVTITAVREASGFVYLTLKGFNDRTSVEKFRNVLLQVPESDLPELEEGEYYRFQLIGLQVFGRDGEALGEVAEIIETGATDVYRVTATEAPDLLLAATPDVVLEIDVAGKRMTVDPPEWR